MDGEAGAYIMVSLSRSSPTSDDCYSPFYLGEFLITWAGGPGLANLIIES
jgi:hypothetical protein